MSRTVTPISIYLSGSIKGTTLETIFHQDISSPLWSAKPIDENPQIIVEAHLAFLRAGARVILTSTLLQYLPASRIFSRRY